MQKNEKLYYYTTHQTKEDRERVQRYLTGLQNLGNAKCRAGDVINAILCVATIDTEFTAKVRKYLKSHD